MTKGADAGSPLFSQQTACGVHAALERRIEVKLSPGKRKRLESVSDSRGVIGALAIDQRDALRKLFSAELKIEKQSVPPEQLEEFKSIVVRVLSPHATAVLLEPEYGLRAAIQRAPSSGLLMAYEVSGYDSNVPGRLPRLLEGWSVRRLIDADRK